MRVSLSKFFIISLVFVLCSYEINAKILSICEAATALKKGGVSKTFASNWVCLMKSESGLNTTLIRGPGSLSSYSYGVFQINSISWCKRGRKGGKCNAKCEDFANDDISDDIVCTQKIVDTEGLKYWKGWVNKCKNQPSNLPKLENCKRRRSVTDEIVS